MSLRHRQEYFKEVKEASLSIFYAGIPPHKSADAFHHFHVNHNFYYLSSVDQENSAIVLVKANGQTYTHLFVKAYDSVEALWVGESLSFEQAAKQAELDVTHVHDIKTLPTFITQQFSFSRRALYGELTTAYFDIELIQSDRETLYGAKKAGEFKNEFPHVDIKNAHPILADLRSVKDEKEIAAIKGALKVHHGANLHIIKTLKDAKNEADIEAEYNYFLHKNHTTTSFSSIVAAGKNATILHYESNNQDLNKRDLVLLDLGVRYNYYASDITRVYPLSGKFSKRQKEVYQAVLDVNKAVINWVKPGITQAEYNAYGRKLLIEAAKKLGLIKEKEDHEISKYYYHGLGHALGLDVHDVGDFSKPFKKGQVLTVEPGLYIASEGIGVRIEDDLLLVEDGCINLSEDFVKEVKDIEKIMESISK